MSNNKTIAKIAIPAILANLTDPILSLTDNYFISKLGNDAIAGVGLSTAVFMSLIWITFSFKGAISAHFAQLFGQKKLSQIAHSYPNIFFQLFILGIILSATLYLSSHYILDQLFQSKSNVLQFATSYLKTRSIGIPFILITAGVFATLRGVQDTKTILKITILSSVLNVLLDYWFYKFGCSFFNLSLEVGLALATVLTQLTAVIISLFLLYRMIPGKFILQKIPLPILSYSKHLFVRTIFLNIVLLGTQRFIQKADSSTIAVHVVFFNCWLFASYFMDGLADAALALTGQHVGEKNTKKIKQLTTRIIIQNLMIALCIGLLFFLTGKYISNLFLHDSNSKDIFSSNIILPISAVIMGSVCFSTDGLLTGAGKTKLLMFIMIFACTLFYSSISIMNILNTPLLTAVWVSLCIWLLARALPAFYYSRKLR